ncbi:hypothetical protein FISHEDRAFT_78001 [Fistulina hepatica ATCC 64428]|nr:hypothetical protein FISHEDRAFT_78001 [Fistulina hepatica ATCC 64428]
MVVESKSLFPSLGLQILSCIINLLGITVLTHCISRRIASEQITSWKGLSQITWPRLCIIFVFVDSWLRHHHIRYWTTTQRNDMWRRHGFVRRFYASSKMLIYLFLVEKVHIVWGRAGTSRFSSWIYLICLVNVIVYAAPVITMAVGRNHYYRSGDGACVIGLKHYSSVSVLAYDLITTAGKRLLRTHARTSASGVALTTSTVNMAVLTILEGHQLGWVCLGACSGDVIANALTLFWVTSGRGTNTGGGGISGTSAPPSGGHGNPKGDSNVVIVSHRASFEEPTSSKSGIMRWPIFNHLRGHGRKAPETFDMQISVVTETQFDRDPEMESIDDVTPSISPKAASLTVPKRDSFCEPNEMNRQ